MQVRRCITVLIEPRARLDFDLASLLSGGTGVEQSVSWVALAPHIDTEVDLFDEEIEVLGALLPHRWIEFDELCRTHPRAVLEKLVDSGLLIARHGLNEDLQRSDQALRDLHWRGLDAVAHRHSRWHGVDTVEAQQRFGEETDQTFVQRLGPAPPPVAEWVKATERLPLPKPKKSALDSLLDTRVTCRNYDLSTDLKFSDFSAVLFRAFGARVTEEYAPNVFLLKKGVPSAGGLHPIEAYVLAQRVEGISSGLYHYHPGDHALEPIRAMDGKALSDWALRCLGGQSFFAQAHVVVVMAARFARNFWKYRNHAKAYRAVILDAGHISQTIYLAATELKLGAFVTAGVNEVDIERGIGLDPMIEGPLAMCGFGLRGAMRNEVEFDPLNAVWAADSAGPR